uniref:Ig-like domain-containing protein n=1 Tax=Stegastes partitus TaxID=144197 RepID=A0A3B5ANP9_9TELE
NCCRFVVFVVRFTSCTDDLSFVTKTVGVGQDVTLACSRNSTAGGILFWFRLVAGNLPEVLGTTYFYGHAISNETPRITAKLGNGTFVLRITQTKLSDTALYYSLAIHFSVNPFDCSVCSHFPGPEPDITAVVQDVPSDSVRPGDPVTLQCSVFSTSEKKTCPEQHRVFWFRAGSDESHPSLIYVHGNSHGECETSAESHSSQKCVYSFSQDVDASDTGTYYCAVATCGQILFGNGAKLDIEGNHLFFISILMRVNTVLFLLCAALVISLIVIALLIYTIKTKKSDCFNGKLSCIILIYTLLSVYNETLFVLTDIIPGSSSCCCPTNKCSSNQWCSTKTDGRFFQRYCTGTFVFIASI